MVIICGMFKTINKPMHKDSQYIQLINAPTAPAYIALSYMVQKTCSLTMVKPTVKMRPRRGP